MITQLSADNAAEFKEKIYLSLDRVSYNKKPAGAEIKYIRNRLSGESAHHSTDFKGLAIAIENGQTAQCALLRDKRDSSDSEQNTDNRFLKQQLFAVDIDNDYKDKESGKKYKSPAALDTPEQILEISRGAGLQPCIISESYSSGKKDPNGETINKYHVIFASSEPVTDVQQSRQVINNLLRIFNADEACKDPARILFGTTKDKQVYYCNAVNTTELLLNCYHAPEAAPAESSPRSRAAADKRRAQTVPAPSAGTWNDQYKSIEADPDILLQMIDTNALSYEEFCSATAAYKAAGGSEDIFTAWAAAYTSNKHSQAEILKSNAATFKGMSGKRHTIGTLKKLCQQYAPDTYNAYMQELAEQTKAERKRRGTQSRKRTEAVQTTQPAPSAAPAKLGPGTSEIESSKLTPLELPFERPANYVDFAFFDEKTEKTIIIPQLLAENLRQSCKYIFVRGADPAEQVRRYWYDKGVYVHVGDEFIKNALRDKIKVFGLTLCKKTYIEEAFYQLSIDNIFHSDTELNADENIINFQNGLLHLDTMEITPHTPDFLSTIQIPCKYNPKLSIDNAPTFKAFIMHLANNDKDSAKSLIEFIGAAISNVNSAHYKKALLLKGNGNCGKSVYISLIAALLSEKYYASSSLEDLESRFGTYTLYNKRIVGDPDIKFIKIGELNKFKQATGGDPIRVEPKGKQQFTIKYKGFLLFGCNQLPLFGGDRGEWVYNRMLLIPCGDPVTEEQRDPLLLNKLLSEQEAIAAAAITALKRTIANKYTFTCSESSKELMKTYKIDNDVVRQFIEECAELRADDNKRDNITQNKFFEAFKEWAHTNNIMKIPNVREFKKSLVEIAAEEKLKFFEIKLHGGVRYYIWTLTAQAKKELGYNDLPGNPYYNNYNY